VASCYRSLNLSWDFQSLRGPNLVRVTTPFIDIVRPCTCYVENVATSAGSVDVHEAVARARLNQSSAGFVEKPLDGAPGFVVPGSVLDHVSQV
jgi:hypothetical protein